MCIKFIWSIEKNTIRHRIALQCLISLGDDGKHKDYELFTDNGDSKLAALYDDMCLANGKKIRKEEYKRLEV